MSQQPTDPERRPSRAELPDACAAPIHRLNEDAIAEDVQLLAAMANDTRYETLRLIAAAERDVCVCEIEPALGVSQGAVSQALSRLYTEGLVTRRKDGRWRYYAATPRAERLLATLDGIREDGDE